MNTPQEQANQIKEDIMMEGLNNYEACDHSELHLDELSKLKADEIAEYMVGVIKLEPMAEAWIATVVGTLWEKKKEFNLTDEWFNELVKQEELPEF